MNIDFPLILVCAVLISGAIWLLDIFLLAPRRAQQAQAAVGSLAAAEVPEPAYVEYAKSFFPILLIVLVLRSFLYEPFQIPSGSMEPTLDVGDFILVEKFAYGLRLPVLGTKILETGDPQRGDVLVFKYPEDTRLNYIKRVIGEPGDEVRYENKRLYINGQLITENFVAELPPAAPEYRLFTEQLGEVTHQIKKSMYASAGSRSWTVPQGHYFVLGDNRDNSGDSRVWGYVPDELVVGKAVVVWMHWDKFFSLPSFADVGAID